MTPSQVIETPWGPIPLFGPVESTGRPLALVITGAFNDLAYMTKFGGFLTEADVQVAHLPGIYTPTLSETSIPIFCRAFDALVDTIGRDLLIVGLSTGGVVGLGMRSPFIRRICAVEPPLTTTLWPMTPRLNRLALPAHRRWAAAIFDQDHRHVLDGLRTPADVLLSAERLGDPRPITHLPSLVSDAAVAALDAHPCVTTSKVVGPGHNVVGDAPEALLAFVRSSLSAAFNPVDGHSFVPAIGEEAP